MDYILNDAKALERLRRDKILKHSIRRIVVGSGENGLIASFQKTLNKNYFACGCREGAIGVYMSLLCFGIVWWRNGFRGSAWWVLVVAVVASIVGKIFGLVLSRYRLRKVFRKLEVYFREP